MSLNFCKAQEMHHRTQCTSTKFDDQVDTYIIGNQRYCAPKRGEFWRTVGALMTSACVLVNCASRWLVSARYPMLMVLRCKLPLTLQIFIYRQRFLQLGPSTATTPSHSSTRAAVQRWDIYTIFPT